DDIFAVQDDIAQSVVKELRAALLGEGLDAAASAEARAEVQAASTGRAENSEAYRLYLQGRYYLERMTKADVARGVEYFEQAIALDPGFALAWTGLSRGYWMQAGYGWRPVDSGFPQALGPLSSSCQRFLGLRCAMYGRLDEAEVALRASLDLNPKAGLVHCFLAITRLWQGHATEALELADREVLPDFRLVGTSMAL